MAGTAKNDWGEGRGQLAAPGGALRGGPSAARPTERPIPGAPGAELAGVATGVQSKTVSFLGSLLTSSEQLFFAEFLNGWETRV